MRRSAATLDLGTNNPMNTNKTTKLFVIGYIPVERKLLQLKRRPIRFVNRCANCFAVTRNLKALLPSMNNTGTCSP
jgi:hypothetical protein